MSGVKHTPELVDAMPDLTAVIAWLRGGCEVKHAITELEIYQRRIDAAIARSRGEQDGINQENHNG